MTHRRMLFIAVTAILVATIDDPAAQVQPAPDPQQLPGDQYDPAPLPAGPGSQQLPDDRWDPFQLPGDQYDAGGDAGQHLILHLPLDGSLSHGGRVGTPRFVVGAEASRPAFMPGRLSQGLLFEGKAAVAAPFNLDHAEYPRVTVTAWIYQEPGTKGNRAIFSSTSSAGIQLGVHGGRLATRVGRRGLSHSQGVPKGEWVFVAAAIDTEHGSARMYINGELHSVDGLETRTSSPPLVADPSDPNGDRQAWVVVGASRFQNFQTTSMPLLIDDVRVYGETLSEAQIAGLRQAGSGEGEGEGTQSTGLQSGGSGLSVPAPGTPVGALPGGTLSNSDALPVGCQAHDDCPTGQYCAFERVCHPDRHAPLQDLRAEPYIVPLTSVTPVADNEPADSAPGTPVPVGSPTLTSVSGEESKTTRTLDLGNEFLTRLTWWEKQDRPCGIRIGGERRELTEELYNCGRMVGGNVFSEASGMLELPTTGQTANHAGRGTGALAVCSNMNNNRRVKGVRIAGDWISTSGTIVGSNLSSSDELPNCEQWRTTVLCGNTQLATGVVVHFTRATGYNEQIVGLQLVCRRVGPGGG